MVQRAVPWPFTFFSCGDFYEAFNEDAKILEEVLGIKINNEKVARFSYQVIDTYLPKLIRDSYRVAISAEL